MLSFLAEALSNGIVGILDRPRQVWLKNATTGSVLEGFKRELFEGISEFGPVLRHGEAHLLSVFGGYGTILPSDGKRYWHEEDLASFLQDHFKESGSSAVLTESIPILWRCFHFHAYFPFPQQSPGQMDCDAFERAVALLATDGSLRLGCADFGDYGIQSDPYRDLSVCRTWRLFRSLVIPTFTTSSSTVFPRHEPNTKNVELDSQQDDLLDVLHLVHPPATPYGSTSRDGLRPHASRILLGTSRSPHFNKSTHMVTPNSSFIPRKDFLNILKSLLSGSFSGSCLSDAQDEKLAESLAAAILQQIAPDEDKDIDWETFKGLLSDHIINFPTQMRSIFTAFIPSSPLGTHSEKGPNLIMSAPYIQYINLLNPPSIQQRDNYHRKVQSSIQRPDLKVPYSATSTTLSATTFASALETIKKSSILFLTGTLTPPSSSPNQSTTTVTFAIPIPFSWPFPSHPETKQNPHIGASHALFQLEPVLQILRSIRPSSQSADLLSLDTTTGVLRFGGIDESGLTVDFERGIAVLCSCKGGDGSEVTDGYRNVSKQEDRWETQMRIEAMELYELQGAAPLLEEGLGLENQIKQEQLASQELYREAEVKRREREAGPKVGGLELQKRIVGIGPRPRGGKKAGGQEMEKGKEMEDDSSDSDADVKK